MSQEEVRTRSFVPSRAAELMEEIFHVVLGVFLFGIAVATLMFSVFKTLIIKKPGLPESKLLDRVF